VNNFRLNIRETGMLFQTFEFGIFFLITVMLVCFTRGRIQKILLLCASLFFYACGSIQHLLVFVFVIIITYLFGIVIEKKRNKIIFSLSIFSSFIRWGLIPRPLGWFKSFTDDGGVADPRYKMRKIRRIFSSRTKIPRCLRRGSSLLLR
jgi:D-alanyl-lipoteichoic acid acyltransferase DltB (MBOAT superfamily)